VIEFVEAGASRREAAEHFEVSASSAIRWVQRFHEDGVCEPTPRGGSTSPLEKYSRQILALIREQRDLTLNEIVSVLGKADDTVEETGASTRCTAGVGDPASKNRPSATYPRLIVDDTTGDGHSTTVTRRELRKRRDTGKE
jgi:hypothetical protein